MPEQAPRWSQKAWPAAGLIAAGFVAVAMLFCFDPAATAIYPVCLFHKFTGLNCPGCGSLRALHHLTHGELGAALHCNPLLVLALPALTWGLIRRLGKRSSWSPLPGSFLRPAFLWMICGLVILFGILRNLPTPAFAWMSP